MIGDITPERIANAILQDRSHAGPYLILEGKKDCFLFKKFIDENVTEIKVAFGNTNVIATIEILLSRGFEKVLGIVDSDFRNLDGDLIETDYIKMTDFHDTEMMIFQSPAFDYLIDYYGQQEKIINLEVSTGKPLRDYILDLAKPLAYLKWSNKVYNLGLIFKPHKPEGKQLSYSDFICIKTFEFSGDEVMVRTVINYSRNKTEKHLDENEILTRMREIQGEHDLLQLCNGHDVCHIISIGLRKKISNLDGNECDHKILEKDFVLAYESRYFKTSVLYRKIIEWESKSGFKILIV